MITVYEIRRIEEDPIQIPKRDTFIIKVGNSFLNIEGVLYNGNIHGISAVYKVIKKQTAIPITLGKRIKTNHKFTDFVPYQCSEHGFMLGVQKDSILYTPYGYSYEIVEGFVNG